MLQFWGGWYGLGFRTKTENLKETTTTTRNPKLFFIPIHQEAVQIQIMIGVPIWSKRPTV